MSDPPAGPGRTAALVGVGFTPFTRASGRSVLALATEAVAGAVGDAGLRLDEVDGLSSFMVSDDSVPCVAVSSALGLGPLRTVLDVQLGGQAPCHLVWQAAQSVARGDAEVVVVYRALNGRSGARVGSMQFAGMGGQYRYPIGYGAYLMYVGMWAQRFLHETGQGPEDLGAVAVSQRRYAQDNERALRREPLALDAYLAKLSYPNANATRAPPRSRHRRPPAVGGLHAQLHQLAARRAVRAGRHRSGRCGRRRDL